MSSRSSRRTTAPASRFSPPATPPPAPLDVLTDKALHLVSTALHGCTPLGGLRLLPGAQGPNMLTAVTEHLRSAYPFVLAKDAVVIDGAAKNVFAWATANYVLRTLESAAVFDLGDAATQILFAPAWGAPLDGKYKYELQSEDGRARCTSTPTSGTALCARA
ncbi:hypothetical protein C8R44DRAFT_23528 [Mycena epipterygia]|nr:hypothetical protein C8R44DRAFT_23528 [Mycena epipterygia]